MAFNFCSDVFLPKIRSSAVSVDGYEVTNLINPHQARSNKGFLAESFVKPPISITIDFPVNVTLAEVVIAATVGSQRSSCFELFSFPQSRRTDTWLLEGIKSGSACTGNPTASSSSQQQADSDRIYQKIGWAQDPESKYFVFKNNGFRANQQFKSTSKMERRSLCPNGNNAAKVVDLWQRNAYNLTNVATLVIRITRATLGSTCALKWIEVWADPARSNPQSWITHLLKLHDQTFQTSGNHSELSRSASSTEPKATAENCDSKRVTVVTTDLPEEFLDSLTQDMLTIPVLLPCGKSINQSSLDRHVKELAVWGHAPCDPFTGQAFTSSSKPVPNGSLKARLDHFLFQNPDIARKHDFRIGRSSSGYSTEFRTTNSVLVQDSVTSSGNESGKMSCTGRKRGHEEMLAVNRLRSHAKRSRAELGSVRSMPSTSVDKVIKPLTNAADDRKNSSSQSSQTSSDSRSSSNRTSDLDSVLKLTLSGLPTYLHKPESKHDITNSNDFNNFKTVEKLPDCSKCAANVEIGNLYRLECGHLLCRQCLSRPSSAQQASVNVLCVSCGQTTTRSQISKAHV